MDAEIEKQLQPFTGTLPQLLTAQAARFGAAGTAIREKAYGIWHAYTWQDYLRYTRHTALGLIALGFRRGEAAGLITDNHPEWLFAELGAQAVGGVTMNLFTSAVAEELSVSLNRIRASIVIVQNQEQADKMIAARDRLGHVRRVIYIDPTGMGSYVNDPWLVSFRDLLAKGEKLDGDRPELFTGELNRGNPEETAMMIQTSGTTGLPKLAMLSHRNFTAIGESWIRTVSIRPGENWISISPPAWIVDQMWGLGVALLGGMTMNFPETPETVMEDFREIGPSRIITSSRFWEEMASRIRVRMSDAGWLKRRLFAEGERIGRAVVSRQIRKEPVPLLLGGLHRLASLIVYRPLLDRIGCANFLGAYTGGHPISPDVISFFRAIGLNLKQCYGLTEAGGIFQIQPDDEVKPETVGKPLPGVEIRIAEDQEVLVSSRSVFQGYYQDYQTTEAAFSQGWLRTGDAGYLDRDGHLLIIGRKEEIIRNKSGEAFSPDFTETRLKFSPFIKEAVIFGEGRPCLTALINIDFGNTGSWAEERMIPYTTYMDLSQQAAVEELILTEIRRVNEQLPEVMKIHKFILLYKLLDADDEELTRTGKVRRRFVYGLYLKLIEAMYTGEKEVRVKGSIRYRDGQIGEIDTRVRIIEVL
ncbi:MAG: AMP-binding protein [Proteobacteria bacterium]|nr:AMP-binding protein [Pseudomonadota bacterium]MBU2228383.1 AMP-binding protein [Pseudomonadota bacterium]MBU2262050.1 AMP-binding protein [Pseudomonadota bacterium]